jgi:glutamate/tyrosine decarboxylase-like PLP-dependent enzyme
VTDFTKNSSYLRLLDDVLKRNDSNSSELWKNVETLFSQIEPPASSSDNRISTRFYPDAMNRDIPVKGREKSEVMSETLGFLDGMLRWHSPTVMHNINPAVTIGSLALTTVAHAFNPQMLWDYVSGHLQDVENKIARQLGKYAGYDQERVDGVTTFGGKACHIYSIRIGLARTIPGYAKSGTNGHSPVVITTKFNHYLIEPVCSLLGLGTDACIRIGTDDKEVLDLNELNRTIDEVRASGKNLACIVLSGGGTLNLNIDPADKVRELIDAKYSDVPPENRPFIYFDFVAGWPWLFFVNYDFTQNPLGIEPELLNKISTIKDKVSVVRYADAFGVDMHKMGFASYNNSMFIVKNKTDLHSIFTNDRITKERLPYGNNFAQHHTIEHSRSGAPVMAAWYNLQTIGEEGFQMYLVQLLQIGQIIREVLTRRGFQWVNTYSLIHASLFYPVNPNGKKDFNEYRVATEDEKSALTNYIFQFTEFVNTHSVYGHAHYTLGFLKAITLPGWNYSPTLLRIYPMSPSTSLEDARKMAEEIADLKEEFDKYYNGTMVVTPEVIHR